MRRSKDEIIHDVLAAVENGEKRITQIVYITGLNFGRARKYLKELESLGLIQRSGKRYAITDKGRQYLEIERRRRKLLGG